MMMRKPCVECKSGGEFSDEKVWLKGQQSGNACFALLMWLLCSLYGCL